MKIVKLVIHEESKDPRTLAFVDMEGLGVGDPDLLNEYLTFRVNTYSKLNHSAGDKFWIILFNPINQFLSTLSPDEQLILGKMFGNAKKLLVDDFDSVGQLEVITKQLSESILYTFNTIQVSKRLVEFVVNSRIPMPDLSGAGKQSYHGEDKTFLHDEYVGLTAIALICKMLCPIFGEIIFLTKKILDNSLKEMHCITVLRLILGQDFSILTEKLQRYLHIQTTKYKKLNLTSTYGGYTHDKFTLFIYASMLVKKFVNVDLYNIDTNIVTYIVTCARYTLGSTISNMSKRNTILVRSDPDEETDVEGNYSRLETESFSSRTTADVPILAKIGTAHMVMQTLMEYDLDIDEYHKALEYYAASPAPCTDINKYILCTFMGHKIGGAYGINMLTAETYMKLITLTQLYMISIGAYEITHIMSIIPTNIEKTRHSAIDIQIQMSKAAGFAYRNCKSMFPYAIGTSSWDAKTKDISDYIIQRIHTYNTAPNLWDLMQQECQNDKTYVYNELILKNIFEFINHILNLAGHTCKEVLNE